MISFKYAFIGHSRDLAVTISFGQSRFIPYSVSFNFKACSRMHSVIFLSMKLAIIGHVCPDAERLCYPLFFVLPFSFFSSPFLALFPFLFVLIIRKHCQLIKFICSESQNFVNIQICQLNFTNLTEQNFFVRLPCHVTKTPSMSGIATFRSHSSSYSRKQKAK